METPTAVAPAEDHAKLLGGQKDFHRVNFANFNQDFSCISVGFEDGYRVYNCEPFSCCYEHKDSSIGIVEMLFSSSLLAIVGSGEDVNFSPRRLKIVNSKRNTTICEFTFKTTILAVKMNRESLIVVLDDTIYVYDISGMRLLHTIETPPNPIGLIALSSNSQQNNYLAYPSPQKLVNNLETGSPSNDGEGGIAGGGGVEGDSKTGNSSTTGANNSQIRNGDIIIFDCNTLHPISVIEAHKTKVAAMVFSNDGSLLATASDKGTIIRVFSVETGVKLYQFRRGTYNTKIYSLAFSPDNMFLIASSATETVHIFRLGEEEAKNTIVKNAAGANRWLSGKPNATDKEIELARQKELEKIVANRENKKSLEEEHQAPSVGHEEENDFDFHASDSEDEEAEEGAAQRDGGFNFNNMEDEEVDELTELPISNSLTAVSTNTSTNSSSSVDKQEPVVDSQRRSMARLLRRTSQSIGRHAAERMGGYLPPRFSSLLEPNRHFASLKVPVSKDTPTVVGFVDHLPSADGTKQVLVFAADGGLFKFALDCERGGDCVLVAEGNLLCE